MKKNFGKHGIINLSNLITRKIEFDAWFKEVKGKKLEELNSNNEMFYFDEFINLFNNGNLPHKKYYDLIKYNRKQRDLMYKKKYKLTDNLLTFNKIDNINKDNFIFDDELNKEKEKKYIKEIEDKKNLIDAIQNMNSQKANAMREIEVKENLLRYYYQNSNMEQVKYLQKDLFGYKVQDVLSIGKQNN